MRFLFGLALTLFGLYLLGKNIIFTTRILPYLWQDISATGAVLCISGGVTALVFLDGILEKAGWIFIFLGVILVFANVKVFVKPTSLWSFFVGITSMLAGFQMMRGLRD